MAQRSLQIGVLGGVPKALGGGGLEIQIDRTIDALNMRGHQAFHVASTGRVDFDVLHAFGNDVSIWHQLSHWRRNPAPLVVSPVLVVRQGAEERLVRILNHIPWRGSEAYMRRELLQRADLLVALTQHERALLAKLAPRVRCEIVGNAVERHAIDGEAEIPPDLPEQTALLLGTVSKRKQQIATILAMREARYTPVVVGGLDGTVSEATLRSALEQVNGRWLGEIHAPEQVHAILSKSAALIQLSRSEGQSLAVLEALSLNVPVILSDLPGNKELAARYPDHVRLCATPQQLGHVLGELGQAPDEPPHVPTWDEVAEKLEGHYYQLLRS